MNLESVHWLGALLHWGDVVPCVKVVQYFAVKDFQIVAEKTDSCCITTVQK